MYCGTSETGNQSSEKQKERSQAQGSVKLTRNKGKANRDGSQEGSKIMEREARQMEKGTQQYDIIIIGGGPAGISAGIYAVSRRKKVLVIEKEKIGGLIGRVSTVTHYTGIVENETGSTFAARMEKQAESAGVQVIYETVCSVSLQGDVKKVVTEKGIYEASRLILANGTTPRKLGIPGEEELSGRGVGKNAARDGKNFAGKNIYVVGGADGAVKEALYLAQFARKLTIIHFEEKLGCIPEFLKKVEAAPNIAVRTGTRLAGIYGKEQIESLEIKDEKTGEITRISDEGCGVFIYAGSVPNTEMYGELKLENGYIPVNASMETEIPGVYAAGDICAKQVRQAATAVAEGAVAGICAAK